MFSHDKNNCNICESLAVWNKILLVIINKHGFYLHNDKQTFFFHGKKISLRDKFGTRAISLPNLSRDHKKYHKIAKKTLNITIE